MRLFVKVAALAAASIVALTSTGGCASFDQWQRRTIFQNEVSLQRDQNRLAPSAVDEFDVDVEPGQHIRMWFLRGDPGAQTVLYLHGARHSLYGCAPRIERLRSLGYNVLALDYRGFGKSSPILPSEATAVADVRAAFNELKRREPDSARRLVYGYSLGGALAIALAAQTDGMAGVVVESSFTSIPDVLRSMRWGWLPFLGKAVTQPFNSIQRVAQVNEPLLFLHGTEDGIVPHTMSDQLFAAAVQVPTQLKRLVKVEGASHRSVMYLNTDAYNQALKDFVGLARRHELALLGRRHDYEGNAATQASAAASAAALH